MGGNHNHGRLVKEGVYTLWGGVQEGIVGKSDTQCREALTKRGQGDSAETIGQKVWLRGLTCSFDRGKPSTMTLLWVNELRISSKALQACASPTNRADESNASGLPQDTCCCCC